MMYREPEFIPIAAGVFALINRKRRFAYVSYTQNLQKRSHSMSHMLMQHDQYLDKPTKNPPYWPIRDLPKHQSDEYTFRVHHEGEIAEHEMLSVVARIQKRYTQKGYRIVAGHRASSPSVTLNGKEMTLAEAVRDYAKVAYLTAYRRLQRGWSVKQALGLEPPAPRWHRGKQAERKQREAERARP